MNHNRLTEIEAKLHSELLNTWQPVAALAVRCNIPVKSALCALLAMEARGIVKKVRSRIDGHNKVHLFKKLDYVKVMGVQMPYSREAEEV
jgi:hypothetical protein